MRKLLTLMGFGLIVMTSACKRSYTCDCTTTYTITSYPSQHVSWAIHDTHGKAKEICDNWETAYGGTNAYTSTTCDLSLQ